MRLQDIRQKYSDKGLSDAVAEFLLDSWRESTKKQYHCYLTKWANYCKEHNINVVYPSIGEVLDFMLAMFDSGLSHSTMGTIRSALSQLITIDNTPVGQHQDVARFMRTVYLKRPTKSKTSVTWDSNEVLSYLLTISPANEISIEMLTKKLLMLMAILAGVRGQTLHLLDTINMTLRDSYASFRVAELTKTSKPGKAEAELYFKAYPCDRRLCVVTYLKAYIERTDIHRVKSKALWVCYGAGKLGKPASRDSISRWIRDVMTASGIDMNIFTSHSTRSSSCSAVVDKIPIDTILRTAGWRCESTFQKYYNKKVGTAGDFQAAILKRHERK